MGLDLGNTALQIDAMAEDLRARQSDKRTRLARAIGGVLDFDVETYERKRALGSNALNWVIPGVESPPSDRYDPPAVPADFRIAAVDGSHIDVDRHLPARCFLINIGACVLTYGSAPDAALSNRPRLYASDDDLVIRNRSGAYQEQRVQGAVLGALRAVEEIRALVEVVRDLPPDLPTLALMDGTLIMFMGSGTRDFVIDELVQRGFVRALDELRELARERPLSVASYISLPASAEFASALRVHACPYETPDCVTYCGNLPSGSRPCDDTAEGIVDREIFSRVLEEGQRSATFASSNALVANSYGDHGIEFFYLNVGAEIGRVEIPDWVSKDEALLAMTHSLVLDQCRRGPGYPVALMESHEQAVITTTDRQHFAALIEDSLQDQNLPTYPSEKNRSKRLRWL